MPRRAPASIFRLWLPLRILRGHPRLFASVAVGLLAGALLPSSLRLATRLLIAWNEGTWFYFIMTGIMIVRASPRTIRQQAKAPDEGRFFILVLTGFAALASIAAIVAHLIPVKDLAGLEKAMDVGLAAATIVSSWFFIHLVFALHYAHEFFDELAAEPGKPATVEGGLVFPGTESPDYFDFLYFSYIIGVACQTADVAISSATMRRTALVHGTLSFFFNSAVLALTINIAAGLI